MIITRRVRSESGKNRHLSGAAASILGCASDRTEQRIRRLGADACEVRKRSHLVKDAQPTSSSQPRADPESASFGMFVSIYLLRGGCVRSTATAAPGSRETYDELRVDRVVCAVMARDRYVLDGNRVLRDTYVVGVPWQWSSTRPGLVLNNGRGSWSWKPRRIAQTSCCHWASPTTAIRDTASARQ